MFRCVIFVFSFIIHLKILNFERTLSQTNVIFCCSCSKTMRRPCLLNGHTNDLEPFACLSPGHDVLINVSSRTEDIPFPLSLLRTSSLTCFTLWPSTYIFTCVSYAEARNSYRLDVRPSVRPSVCSSVRPSHADTLSKRLNILSCFLHHTIAHPF